MFVLNIICVTYIVISLDVFEHEIRVKSMHTMKSWLKTREKI